MSEAHKTEEAGVIACPAEVDWAETLYRQWQQNQYF